MPVQLVGWILAALIVTGLWAARVPRLRGSPWGTRLSQIAGILARLVAGLAFAWEASRAAE